MTTLNASETEGQMRLEARLIEADQLTRALSSCLMRGEDSLELVPRLIQKILVTESWKARQRHGEVVKHARFIDYLTTTPPEGLGVDPVRIKRLLWREPRILAMFERAIAEGVTQGTRTDLQPRNNVTKLVRGNSQAYTLRRLQRDRPDLLLKVEAGTMTAHQAAKEAGFRKTLTPFEQIVKLVPKVTNKEWQAIVKIRKREKPSHAHSS